MREKCLSFDPTCETCCDPVEWCHKHLGNAPSRAEPLATPPGEAPEEGKKAVSGQLLGGKTEKGQPQEPTPVTQPTTGVHAPMATQTPEPAEHILQFFGYQHLPVHLQAVSALFYNLATEIMDRCPRNPERTVALRKLLESKDAAVRAALAKT